jgi:flagellar basal body-associated protein FliL
VADDKKKDDQEGEGKKKGLPAFVMIAIGAIVGGAGVVFAVPPKTVEVETAAPVFNDVEFMHPDPIMKDPFNPVSTTGKSVARVTVKFMYTVREDREEEALELIKLHWDVAEYEAAVLLRSRTTKELKSNTGQKIIEHDLMHELSNVFFSGSEPVAKVTKVMLTKVLLQ